MHCPVIARSPPWADRNDNLMIFILFFIGLLLTIFSHPKVLRFVMSRLFNEGLVTPRALKPEKAELVKYAGSNLSLFAIGVVLMLLSLILRQS